MIAYFIRVNVVVMKPNEKSKLCSKELTWFTYPEPEITVYSGKLWPELKPVRNLKAKADLDTIGVRVTGLLFMVCPTDFLYN